jgi:DNA-binding transcriptional ArsR family regulator
MNAGEEISMTRAAEQASSLDLVFGALADATRRSMVERLRKRPLTVTELAEPYAMSLNAVSKHAKALERAGLIRRHIRGREHSCELERARFDEAMHWMSYYSEFWSSRMDALEKHLLEKRRRERKG